MINHKITIIALATGIVFGGTGTEGFNIYRHSHDSQIFQERARCKAVADAYVKENSTNFKEDPDPADGVTVTLDKVDYSPARNSCVAELERTDDFGRTLRESSSVEDLLSGESLYSESCTGDCAAQISVFTARAFDYVMKNASEPLELQEAYARYASEIQPKSASPSTVTQSDAHGNPVTAWDASGNPIPSTVRQSDAHGDVLPPLPPGARLAPSAGTQRDAHGNPISSKSLPKSAPSSGRSLIDPYR